MTYRRSAVVWLALALLPLPYVRCDARQGEISAKSNPEEVLHLNLANNGQRLRAAVGQIVEITLQTIGPGNYEMPQTSCSSIRFEGMKEPLSQNPGGPTQIYRFRAAAAGMAQLQIPHNVSSKVPFTVTIQIGSLPDCPAVLRPSMRVDQANTAVWDKGWTNLVNNVQQTFIPSLPTLAAIEVQLVVANPGPAEDTVTMSLLDGNQESLAVVSKTVSAAEGPVLFDLGGLEVSPGKVYSIHLSSGTTFGWKYVTGGYQNGAAWFNGRPLLQNTRSTFLFRTFAQN